MDINISILIESDFNPHDVYGSVSTHGEDVASDTWSEALEYAKVLPNFFDTDEKEAAIRRYIISTGLWAEEDYDDYGLMDVSTLFLQLVAAEMVDYGFDPQNPDWYILDGTGSGVFGGHLSSDGEAYFSLG